ncbi:MAG: RluA family pseudouridine synthase [Myxococcales bacterium]|nr:RluA family pseudouridine synthase [Myxococcales bacterium]
MREAAQSFEIAGADVGMRVDRFLATRLGLSRTQIRRLLAEGGVRLAGRPLVARSKGVALRAGDRLEVDAYTPVASQRVIAQPELELSVLAQGPGWLAVDKPAGVPVHPLAPGELGTLLNALIARFPELHGVGEGGLKSGVVHRLDVDTSGVLLVATEPSSWQRLRAAFREHRVEKCYRALVAGHPEPGRVELPLVVTGHRPARVRVARPGEAASGVRLTVTAWQVVERLSDASLVEVQPVTGYLHQIRATFAHLGAPVLGDRRYAEPEVAARAPRQLLHAARLRFEEIEAEAPDPPDLQQARRELAAAST